MKVKSELSGRCDFCGWSPATHTINGGLWWLCTVCMNSIYDGCNCTEDLVLVHLSECKFASGGEEE